MMTIAVLTALLKLRVGSCFFIFKSSIFDYMRPGEELVGQPCARLIEERELTAFRYTGFWSPIDTFKDKQYLDELNKTGHAPWRVWNNHGV